MNDIGNKLKEKREENGVSIEEASEDLNVRPSQLISLEEGKKEDFKDPLTLKYLIRDYAKYLGIDGEALMDEFNEFLFDFTSKIPVQEIASAMDDNDKKEITSPYTKDFDDKKGFKFLVIAGVILVVVIVLVLVVRYVGSNSNSEDNITYLVRG